MAEIVNLRRARKQRARRAADETAAANRAAHGRTTTEKRKADAVRRETDRVLDGAKLNPPEAD